ncbi:hypothetical protein [Pseudomonas nitroreducens]|uniref:hypothetical protein n=1 Tax=Pseudomonas nitroreducens TaxID=46680 RepID=UPI0018762126|nr:hypothetical protein [Pseudomonas nitritireducens]
MEEFEIGQENYPGMAWNTCSITFLQAKKRPPGEAAKPKDDEVEQSSGRSGAGIRDSCSSSGRKLNSDSDKCLIIRLDIDYRQGWLEGEAADCYLFARSAYGGET